MGLQHPRPSWITLRMGVAEDSWPGGSVRVSGWTDRVHHLQERARKAVISMDNLGGLEQRVQQ